MLTTFQKIKETILITILNVLLPSVDIFTDLGSVIKLYIGTRIHPDCDKRSELEPYTSEEDGLIAAIEKCVANSSADRITYVHLSTGLGHGPLNAPLDQLHHHLDRLVEESRQLDCPLAFRLSSGQKRVQYCIHVGQSFWYFRSVLSRCYPSSGQTLKKVWNISESCRGTPSKGRPTMKPFQPQPFWQPSSSLPFLLRFFSSTQIMKMIRH